MPCKTTSVITTCRSTVVRFALLYLSDVYVVSHTASKLCFLMYNLSSAKVDQESTFPTNTAAFLGRSPHSISLENSGQNAPIILRDGNGAIYPLAKDYVGGIRDPLWLGLPPVQCLSIGIQSLMNVTPNSKNRVAVIGFALQVSQLALL